MTSVALLLVTAAGPQDAPAGMGIIGMAVLVVVLISLAVLLPRLRRGRPVEAAVEGPPPPTEEEVLAAVCAIDATFSRLEQLEHVQMTWRMYEKPYRPWRLAGRAEFLTGKQSVHNRARNRSR